VPARLPVFVKDFSEIGYAEAWNNICAANNKLGGYDEAAVACEQALRSKPAFELARNNLQYAHQMAKPSGK
jgi:hypothetical protein